MPSDPSRRLCLSSAALGAVALATPAVAAPSALALGARAHFYARPEAAAALEACFTDILECGPSIRIPAAHGLGPILAFGFSAGGSVSVEFTHEAPDAASARRGAWLELRSPEAARLQAKVLAGGLERIVYPATKAFYFAAPGGQVFSLVQA